MIAIGGVITTLQMLEPQIATERASRYDAERSLESDRAVLARADTLVAQSRRDHVLLRGIDLDDDAATVVARFISDVARLAAASHVRVTQLGSADKGANSAGGLTPPAVVTMTAPPSAPNVAATPRSTPLTTTRIAVKLEGGYRDLLTAMRGFSALSVLAELDVAALERVRGNHLAATLSVVLYRRAPETSPRADGMLRKGRLDASVGPA